MSKKRRLRLRGIPDPFILLKFSQAFREIAPGDRLEVLYEGNALPGELFKMMPRESYKVVSQTLLEKDTLYLLVLEKTAAAVAEKPVGGCDCLGHKRYEK